MLIVEYRCMTMYYTFYSIQNCKSECLKTVHIHYFKVSVDQECGNGLAGSSDSQSLAKLQSRYCQHCNHAKV